MKEFAFPHWDGPSGACHNGMTLRDWFAGMAMAGWLASYGDQTPHPANSRGGTKVATWSYAMADAMLEERLEIRE